MVQAGAAQDDQKSHGGWRPFVQQLKQAIWAHRQIRDGRYSSKTIAFPHECEECPEHSREEWGCGFDGYAGQGYNLSRATEGATLEPWSWTCPQYYHRQHWIQQLLTDLEDYRRGALGCILDLPVPYIALLRVADAERRRWESIQESTLMEQAEKNRG